jgi:hypothetical protein
VPSAGNRRLLGRPAPSVAAALIRTTSLTVDRVLTRDPLGSKRGRSARPGRYVSGRLRGARVRLPHDAGEFIVLLQSWADECRFGGSGMGG